MIGNSVSGTLAYRKDLDIVADRPVELQTDDVKVYAEVTRSSLTVLQFDAKLRKAVALQRYVFPYCRDNTRWAQVVGHVLSDAGIANMERCVIDGVATSVIPTDLFVKDEGKLSAIMQLEHGPQEGVAIVHCAVDVWDAQCVSAVPTALLALLPRASVLGALEAWKPSLLRHVSAAHAHVYVGEHSFRLAILKGRELLLYNEFVQESAADVLYFTMAALEQLVLLHTETPVTLYGDVRPGGELFELFSTYLPKVVLGEKPIEHTYSYSFKELEGHAAPFILNAPLCA